ncbi:hypothetical protein [uncultured Dokdonia sp.]|uniref:hypothetical protein n=1 Tax=uncultured Dokdonia sp. TaxID=575653 RepID=UPI0026260CA9|nr:hypothetical protein [uncultured Dokdonia sp.]
MMRYAKFTEWIYAIVAVLAGYETFSTWNEDRNKAYLFLFFTVISLGMVFFRRHFRKKFEKRK